MTRVLRLGWAIFIALSVMVALGVGAFEASSRATKARLPLIHGAGLEMDIWRLFPDGIRLSLLLDRASTSDSEAGEWQVKKIGSQLDFQNPGAPIRILVQSQGHEEVYEAMPANAYDETLVSRKLVPFLDDGDPHRFTWPPALPPGALSSGTSTIKITVLDVGNSLAGRDSWLVLEPPLGFKSFAAGYGILWWFFFWPVYVLALCFYFALLLWWTARQRGVVSG